MTPDGTPRRPTVGGDDWNPTVGGSGSDSGNNGHGSGFAFLPWWIEVGLLGLVVLALGAGRGWFV